MAVKNQMDLIVSSVSVVCAIAGVIVWMQTKPTPVAPPKPTTSNVKEPVNLPNPPVVFATALPGAGPAAGGQGQGRGVGGGGGGGGPMAGKRAAAQQAQTQRGG